jgi:Ca2+/H+ antiporter, TMEM165/GDT1 family
MRDALAAFAAVFLAELPDKTMVATLLMTARTRRPLHVWLGAVGAFAVQVTVAVLAGSLIGRLPKTVVGLIAAAVFAIGGVVLLRGAARDEEVESVPGETPTAPSRGRAALAMAFSAVLLAELGDLTQLTTAGMAARASNRLAVGVAAWAALATVAALAAFGGRWVGARLRPVALQRIAGVVFLGIAALVVVGLLL